MKKPPPRLPAQASGSRRALLQSVLGLPGVSLWATRAHAGEATERLPEYPFTLGVASGYPYPDGMVLWTRLAPTPSAPGGGMPPSPVPVEFVVAKDEGLDQVVTRGTVWADPQWAHSVHAEPRGLSADTWYWYQFRVPGWSSPVGRTRTTPHNDAPIANMQLRVGVACCQHYEVGYFTAYQQMVADKPDLILHLGDYIYEGTAGPSRVRTLTEPVAVSLEDYRIRHAHYKQDPDLQRAHAACPWLVTWDDHEVDNDYMADQSATGMPREWFLARRTAAYKAYYEHMPLPRWMMPFGPHMRLNKEFWFGSLARVFMLDTRQYRDVTPCADNMRGGFEIGSPVDCDELLDPTRSMLGWQQRSWLLNRLQRETTPQWNLLAQQTLFQPAAIEIRDHMRVFPDGWDGYPGERDAILNVLAKPAVKNPVVLSGDVHAFYANALAPAGDKTAASPVATEFACGAITSGVPSPRFVNRVKATYPAVRFTHVDKRGYLRLTINESTMKADMIGVETVRTPNAKALTIAAFEVSSGQAGPQRLSPSR
ncbi:MAG: alkaline phosphatase [Burkholderiaceae bacterium]